MMGALHFLLEAPIGDREAKTRSVAQEACKILIHVRETKKRHDISSLVEIMFAAKGKNENLAVSPVMSFIPLSGIRSAFDPAVGFGIVRGDTITFLIREPDQLRLLMDCGHAESLVTYFARDEADVEALGQRLGSALKNQSDESRYLSQLQPTGSICFFASSHKSWEIFTTIPALKHRWLPLLDSHL